MPGKTIGMSLNFGYPGSYSRNPDCVIRNEVAAGDIPFGAPVVLNADGSFSAFKAANTAEQFVGVSIREVKQQTDYYSDEVVYKDKEPVDCLMRGSAVVKITSGTPKANSAVYIRIAESDDFPGSKVGDFVAEADGAKTVQLTNAVFYNGKIDSNGVAEITVLSRKA